MHADHERAALTVAATLLKQARRVLRHAQDAQAAHLKLSLDRMLPMLPAEYSAEPDESGLFTFVASEFSDECADALRDGEKTPPPAPTANETALQEQLEAMRAEQSVLNAKLSSLLENK